MGDDDDGSKKVSRPPPDDDEEEARAKLLGGNGKGRKAKVADSGMDAADRIEPESGRKDDLNFGFDLLRGALFDFVHST